MTNVNFVYFAHEKCRSKFQADRNITFQYLRLTSDSAHTWLRADRNKLFSHGLQPWLQLNLNTGLLQECGGKEPRGFKQWREPPHGCTQRQCCAAATTLIDRPAAATYCISCRAGVCLDHHAKKGVGSVLLE